MQYAIYRYSLLAILYCIAVVNIAIYIDISIYCFTPSVYKDTARVISNVFHCISDFWHLNEGASSISQLHMLYYLNTDAEYIAL